MEAAFPQFIVPEDRVEYPKQVSVYMRTCVLLSCIPGGSMHHSQTPPVQQRLERLKSKLKEIGHPKRAPFHPHAQPPPSPYARNGAQHPAGPQQEQGQRREDSSGSLSSALGACVRAYVYMYGDGSVAAR